MESPDVDWQKKRISSLLTTCYICKTTYRNPKVLSCYHTFCESCLQESVPGQALSLHCLICGHQSILPKEGVGELLSNPYVTRIMQSLEDENNTDKENQSNVTDVSELHANLATNQKDNSSPVAITSNTAIQNEMRCNSQCDEPVAMYCRSCDMVVCKKCAKFEHVEHYDAITSLQEVSLDCEEALLKQADALEQKMSPLQKALQEITQLVNELESSKDASVNQITDNFDKLEEALRQRKGELLQKVNTTYETKLSKLTEQLKDIKLYVESMEEGLDVIVQSLSDKSQQESHLDDASRNRGPMSDTGAFFLHKQVSKKIDDLCKYRLHNEGTSSLMKDDSTSTVSEHSVRLTGAHGTQTYQAPVKLTVPCENSHISIENMQNTTKIRHLISSLGTMETSQAIAQRSVLSGESITAGVCKVGCENTIILTAKMWSGDLETSGKVVTNVKLEYIGPNDDDGVITYRGGSPSSSRPNSVIYRKTSNGLRSPRPLSGSNFSVSSPTKQALRRSKPSSPSPSGGRSPLKDIFFHTNPGSKSSSMVSTPTSQDSEHSDSHEPTSRVDYIKNGAYEITFVPHAPGKYKMTVEMYGREIPHGSFVLFAHHPKLLSSNRIRTPARTTGKVNTRPQSVRQKGMKRPPSMGAKKNPIEDDLVQKVGRRGRAKGEFSNPQGVSTDHLGRLLVADSTNQCIQVFSVSVRKTRDPKYLFRFGERGRGSGQVQRPTGVCGLPNGDIAVSDYDNKVVKIFREDGTSKLNIGGGKLMGPKGLCLDQNGHLVIVDNKLCEIFVFQLSGRLVTKFGTRGTEPHQLAGPHFIAINNDNFFYISDFYNHCVKIFTPRGDCVSVIGSTGEGCGQFNAPTGLAIDPRGNLIVADWGNSRLQVFDKTGSFLSYINTNEDPLYGPQGVTLIQDEYIAVADSGNQCVKIYRYLQ